MVLQLSLSNLKGTYLPRDSIDSMLSALTVRTRAVMFKEMFIYRMLNLGVYTRYRYYEYRRLYQIFRLVASSTTSELMDYSFIISLFLKDHLLNFFSIQHEH